MITDNNPMGELWFQLLPPGVWVSWKSQRIYTPGSLVFCPQTINFRVRLLSRAEDSVLFHVKCRHLIFSQYDEHRGEIYGPAVPHNDDYEANDHDTFALFGCDASQVSLLPTFMASLSSPFSGIGPLKQSETAPLANWAQLCTVPSVTSL